MDSLALPLTRLPCDRFGNLGVVLSRPVTVEKTTVPIMLKSHELQHLAGKIRSQMFIYPLITNRFRFLPRHRMAE